MTDDMRPAVAKALLTIGAHMYHDTDETDLLAEVLNDVYNAGANDARQWHPLTSDPKTWPEEGQRVATLTRSGLLAAHSWFVEVDGRAVDAGYTTHWLPLPEPPKEKSEGEERMSDIDIAIRRFDLSEYEGWCMELVNELLTEYPAGEILWVQPPAGDPGSGDDD